MNATDPTPTDRSSPPAGACDPRCSRPRANAANVEPEARDSSAEVDSRGPCPRPRPGAGIHHLTPAFQTPTLEAEDPTQRIDCAWRLGLAHALQTTLEVGRTVELFAQHSARIVAHDALTLSVPRAGLHLTRGRPGARRHRVELALEDHFPVRLTFSRRPPFDAREVRALEAMSADLARPLDNALRFREACRAATRDPLTGAANRACLDRMLEREVRLVRRHGDPLALLMVDVDRFKQVNDRFGHLAGDRCLAAIARCISGCIRRSDALFRYGGEEFCVLLPRTGGRGARRLAERVRDATGRLRIPSGAETIRLSVSLGVAALGPGDGAADLLGRADSALYRAKRAGGNRVSASGHPCSVRAHARGFPLARE